MLLLTKDIISSVLNFVRPIFPIKYLKKKDKFIIYSKLQINDKKYKKLYNIEKSVNFPLVLPNISRKVTLQMRIPKMCGYKIIQVLLVKCVYDRGTLFHQNNSIYYECMFANSTNYIAY